MSLHHGSAVAERDFTYRVEGSTTRLSGSDVTGVFNLALGAARLRLNNIGARHGHSWHKPNDSVFEIPGIIRRVFDIPEVWSEGGAGNRRRRLFYVEDVNMLTGGRGPSLAVRGGELILTLGFESEGTEIEGKCLINKVGGGWRQCTLGADKGTPDVQINGLRIEVVMAPRVYDGSFTYGEIRDVRLDVDRIQAGGICKVGSHTFASGDDLGGDVCRAIYDYKGEIWTQVIEAARTTLDSNEIRAQVAAVAREQVLDSRDIGLVTSVRGAGDGLEVTHVPRSAEMASR
ncbi:MAG: hypothetical protein GWN84_06260 [Gammaproteobacteria bacterium]|nr:hypothetical protein [Gammaproteobacteria bacterium]NIR82512.1 hypothetical protein [Gammaproteobacteria bacterium]NIU03643.1 hypothetical protein [Gammaproteobacteria bacterium]NIX84917.1 hypothetical protein [Gammaproteobacteria bacterium]